MSTLYRSVKLGSDVRFSGPEAEGTFSGYGSIFSVTDSYGTRIMPGAWRSGGLDAEPYALIWMHDPTVVLGTFTAREDEKGLLIEGRYDFTDVGQRARQQALSGSAPELSVGFEPLQTLDDDESAFISTRLVEVSQITTRFAATPGAELAAVRATAALFTDRPAPKPEELAQLQDDAAAATLQRDLDARRTRALTRARLQLTRPQR